MERINEINEILSKDTPFLYAKITKEMGIGLYTKKEMKKGEKFSSLPFLSSSLIDQQHICDYCLQILENRNEKINCRNCFTHFYCSKNCEKKSWENFHFLQCNKNYSKTKKKIKKNLKFSVSSDCNRIFMIDKLAAMTIKNLKEKKTTKTFVDNLSSFNFPFHFSFYWHCYQLTKSLISTYIPSTFLNIFDFNWFCTQNSVISKNGFSIKMEIKSLKFPKKKKNKNKVKKIEKIPFLFDNSFPNEIESNSDHFGASLNEGTHLYFLHSYLNHSCQPNLKFSFTEKPKEIVFEASENIERDQQLFISYVPTKYLSSKEQRDHHLLMHGICDCCCEKCKKEEQKN